MWLEGGRLRRRQLVTCDWDGVDAFCETVVSSGFIHSDNLNGGNLLCEEEPGLRRRQLDACEWDGVDAFCETVIS